MSTVSIIIPVFNGEKYLLECLQSVQKQTFKKWECVCVDDGSKDKSLDILQYIAKEDSRFKIISQLNEGVTSARRNGVEHATGEYICFVDCDDVLPDHALETLWKRREEYNAEIVIGNWMTTTEALEPLELGRALPSNPTMVSGEQSLRYTYRFGYLARTLIPKKYISARIWPDMKVKLGEDALTLFAITLNCNRILLIPDCVYWYRIQANSACHMIKEKSAVFAKIYFDYFTELDRFIQVNSKHFDLSQLHMLAIDILFHKLDFGNFFSKQRFYLFSAYFRYFIFSLRCQKIYWGFSWKNWAWVWLASYKFFYN